VFRPVPENVWTLAGISKNCIMDYLDRVFLDLKAREPGRYSLIHLREPERFIDAVKELMDGEWIRDVHFTSDYKTLVIQEPFQPTKKVASCGRQTHK